MPMPGASPLDAPPSSPQIGQQPIGSMAGMAPPIPTSAMPPELLTGLLQAGQKMGEMIDSFAQVTPDLAADWSLLKDLLQRILGKAVGAGAGPAASPTEPGGNYPGGGFDRAGFGA